MTGIERTKFCLDRVHDRFRASLVSADRPKLFFGSWPPNLGLGQRSEFHHAPLIFSERAVKRALDIAAASVAITILSPIVVFAAIAIKLDNPGPVIFRQRRNGFNGKEFVILKFRTMTVVKDRPSIKKACCEHSRVTRVGRFLRRTSMDELPQLINVLKGDMSLVGPRPHSLTHNSGHKALIAAYAFRHRIKPGITGWAQIHGLRGETTRLEQMEERIKFDLWYIENWSFGLDLKILVWTCMEVLRDGAY